MRAAAGRRWTQALRVLPIAALAIALALPVLAVLIAGLRPGSADALLDSRTWRIIGFTALQAGVSTVVSILVALPAAYALFRIRPRGTRVLLALLTVPFVLPTIVVGLALRVLLPADIIGTLTAVVLAHVLFNVGLCVRVIGGLWSHLDHRSLDVARTLGLGPLRVWRTVTWPFLRPAVLSAAVLVGLFTFTSFGVIVVLGSRPTLEVEIYRRTVQLLDIPAAAGLALLQVLFVAAALIVSARLQRSLTDRSHLAPIPPRPAASALDRLSIAATVIVALGVVFPLLTLAVRSLRVGPTWGLEWYVRLWQPVELTTRATPAWESIGLSLRYAAVATALATLVGVAAALALAHSERGRSGAGEVVTLLPLGVSAVTVGFGLLLVSLHGPVDLRGTALLVPLGQALVAAPLVVLVMLPVLRAADPRLPHVAATLGASPARAWWVVQGAIVRRHAPVAAALAAAVSLGEFGATAFLARADAPTIPVQIVRLLGRPGEANVGMAAALSVVLLVLTAAILMAADRLRPRWGTP